MNTVVTKSSEAQVRILITGGNLRNGHFYLPKNFNFLPSDTWGGANTLGSASKVSLNFEGTRESIETDIDGSKKIFRNARGQTRRFFDHHSITENDSITLLRTAERAFVVRYERTPIETIAADDVTSGPVDRRLATINRLVRDSAIAREVKNLYDCQCQVCGLAIETLAGPYAEGAHIRPLGSPHSGPDNRANILCLCPNHHVMLDVGCLTINDDLSLEGVEGKLRVLPKHGLDTAYLAYHRQFWRAKAE
jgi:predicted restriction endonuclease